jgi:tRNA 2-thiouridine synthesizing protein A
MTLVDARGHRCPVPTLRLRKALEGLATGDRLTLLADDPMARIDVPHFISQVGARMVEQSEDGGGLRFLVEKG